MSSKLDPSFVDLLQTDPEFAEIVLSFVESLPDKLQEIEQSHTANDLPLMRKLVHKLAGSDVFGGSAVSVIARDLEQDIDDNKTEEVAAGLEKLKTASKEITEELKSLIRSKLFDDI